jgi:hypothetical protein
MTLTVTEDAYHYGNENDQISLTQAAILLSNWGPNTFESETNRYWIDAAFEHAKAARIHKVRWGPQTKQQRVIWVCCLIRGRVVSYHSPIKHQRHLWRYKADLLCPEDFESDVQSSWYMDEKDNRKAVHAFLSLARLSDIIPLRRYHVVGANLSEKKSSLLASELLEISKIQEAICDWTQSQDQVLDSDNRTSQHALSIHFLYILKE